MNNDIHLSQIQERARILSEVHGDDFLDDVIHDLHADMAGRSMSGGDDGTDPGEVYGDYEEAASRVNNEGPGSQAAFLVEELGEMNALSVIEKAAAEAEVQE
ncbi:hypothetical protein [Thioalkalivibrio sp. ALE19]|uniref:hypothetical protein n=1 Tax=Thioalkalivibrio sp. ALE19 TaxID=1266909 RepID=UPI00040D3D93|nr:hypothetical protein [Thioalkalivibrio sp. ALE19]